MTDPVALAANLRTDAASMLALADSIAPQAGPIVAFTATLGAVLVGENGTFTLTAPQTVAYGPYDKSGPNVSRLLPPGSYPATAATFGDPAPGKFKAVFATG